MNNINLKKSLNKCDFYNSSSDYQVFRKELGVGSKSKYILTKNDNKTLKMLYESMCLCSPSVRILDSNISEFSSLLGYIDFKQARDRWEEKQLEITKRKRRDFLKKQSWKNTDANEIIDTMKNTTKIGLGLESSIKLKRVTKKSVVIDKQTQQKLKSNKSIIYVAGWNIDGAFDND